MFSIWWPVFLLPLAMVLGGVAGGVLPGRKYRGPRGVLPSEEQREADRVFCRFLWQFGLVYAALAFMVMRTVRLVSLSGQRWFLIGAVAVEIIGAALMLIPVERTMSLIFSFLSSAETCELMVGCVRCSSSAAREKLQFSTT